MRTRPLLLTAVAALLMAVGCDTRSHPLISSIDGTGGTGTSTFNITPSSVTLNTGQSAQLTLNSSRAIGPYNWSSNQTGVATVTSEGLVTAVGTGVATVTVTSSVDRTASASASVTVRSSSP